MDFGSERRKYEDEKALERDCGICGGIWSDFADFIVSKVLITYSDFPVLDEKVEHNGRFGVIGHSGCFSG